MNEDERVKRLLEAPTSYSWPAEAPVGLEDIKLGQSIMM